MFHPARSVRAAHVHHHCSDVKPGHATVGAKHQLLWRKEANAVARQDRDTTQLACCHGTASCGKYGQAGAVFMQGSQGSQSSGRLTTMLPGPTDTPSRLLDHNLIST